MILELFALFSATAFGQYVVCCNNDDDKHLMKDLLKPITPSHDETYGGLCVIHKEDGWNE